MPNLRTRRHIAVVLAVASAVAVAAAVALTRGPSTVDAEAVVIAQQLDMSPTALPRYGEAVFTSGGMAPAVAEELGVDAGNVVPDRVSLESQPDSMVLTVTGHAEDEATAMRIANTAATAYIVDLNRPGEGVGQFSLLSPARPTDPALPRETVPDTVLADLPLAITVVLAIGVLLLFTRLNRARASS